MQIPGVHVKAEREHAHNFGWLVGGATVTGSKDGIGLSVGFGPSVGVSGESKLPLLSIDIDGESTRET